MYLLEVNLNIWSAVNPFTESRDHVNNLCWFIPSLPIYYFLNDLTENLPVKKKVKSYVATTKAVYERCLQLC